MGGDPYKYFRIEAREILEALQAGVLALERDARPDEISRLLRLAHTLKGAARVVKQKAIADQAHAVEDALEPFRSSSEPLPRPQVDALLRIVDAIGALTQQLDAPPPSTGQVPASEPIQGFRADTSELDALVDGVAETTVRLGSFRESATSIERARRLADLLTEQLAPQRAVRTVDAARIRSMASELSSSLRSLDTRLATGIEQMERELRQVRETAERLRLVPVRAALGDVERAARDTAHALDKRIAFSSSGGDVRCDADALAIVRGALVQAARNAVVHGIEADRGRVGKPAEGRLSVDVLRRGNKIGFVVKDDGRGLDLDALRRVAADRGITGHAGLTPEQLFQLMLQGNLSTSTAVTVMSGRGIGLDIVREAAARLGGTVRFETAPGAGMTLELVIPTVLASIDALTVEAAGRRAAIPLPAIRRTLRLSSREITASPTGGSILFEGAALPFAPLALALGDGSAGPRRDWSVVVIGERDAVAAIGVDHLIATGPRLVRPLPAHMSAHPAVAGASLDAEGRPEWVLDPAALAEWVARPTSHAAVANAAPSRVLVVDDSLTTRMLEQSILESAGYRVELATSAEAGLEKARAADFDLFLVDVEMPGMDGFAFVEHTRNDHALRDTPAVLVTSRASPEDRARGAAVGARAYIVKSEFDQVEFLATIRGLVGARS